MVTGSCSVRWVGVRLLLLAQFFCVNMLHPSRFVYIYISIFIALSLSHLLNEVSAWVREVLLGDFLGTLFVTWVPFEHLPDTCLFLVGSCC